MPAASIYLDECVDHGLVPLLQRRGVRVTTAQAAGALGLDDEAQLELATRLGLAILSHNHRHFQRLHAAFESAGKPHAGIVSIPDSGLARLEVRAAMMLDWLDGLPDMRSRLCRWNDLQAELTGGLVLSGYSDAEVAIALGRLT